MKKKVLIFLCAICFMIPMAFMTTGCNRADVDKELVQIALSNIGELQTTYYTSDNTYDIGNTELTLLYNDDSSEEIALTIDMLSTFNNSVGRHTCTVTYQEKTTSFQYTVEAVRITSIRLKTAPQNSYFTSDSNYYLNDAKVVVNYNDGSNEEIDLTMDMLSAFDNSEGKHICTVTYQSKTTLFLYTVQAVQVTSISLSTTPQQSYYTSDSNYKLSGEKITVNYNDDSSEEIALTVGMLSAFNNSVGTHTCTVTYKEKTTSFQYTVQAVQVTSISLKTTPQQSYYTSDSNYKLSGEKITVNYNDGSSEEIVLTVDMLSAFNNSEGKHICTVTYQGLTTSFQYTVEAVRITSIRLKTAPQNSYFTSDINYYLNDAKVVVNYNDGSNKEIALTVDMLSTFNNSVGTHTCTVTYQGLTTSFQYIVQAVQVTSISLKTTPQQSYYTSDSNYKLSGEKITVNYNDDSSEEIALTLDMLSAFNNSVGTHTCTVTYQGLTTSFQYTVQAVKAVEITAINGLKTSYLVDEGISLTDATITFENNDGSTGNTILLSSMVFGFSTKYVGNFSMSIEYELASYYVDYTVLYKDYISTSVKKISNNDNQDLGTIYLLTRLNADDNSFTIKQKVNETSEHYSILKANVVNSPFKVGNTTYNVNFSENITLNDGTLEYTLVPVQLATKYNVYLDSSVVAEYVDIYDKLTSVSGENLKVFAGEKIRIYAKKVEGQVATAIICGTSKYSFVDKDSKFYEYKANNNVTCYAETEKSTKVNVEFKLKSVNSYGDPKDYDYGATAKYDCVGDYTFQGVFVNNSSAVQGTINKSGNYNFTDEYQGGCSKGTDLSSGEEVIISKVYSWTSTAEITSSTSLQFNIGITYNVTYALNSSIKSEGSVSKDVSFRIKNTDLSSYSQQQVIIEINTRFKIIIEISITEET